ncbi:DUF1800 family protein [uncultured Alsobacter sp.]|uniref:DUF1800 domain-containing protein n=1 Tax=uncultured Alsobacter sp. TaxID=1748258 RepID=UPI0025D65773|nr:DUF1800 family protein [uncultured Alsobacter sp.]
MTDPANDLRHALNRFGLGGRPGEPQRIAGDPRGAVLAQLARTDAALLSGPALPATSAAYVSYRRQEIGRERERLMVAAATAQSAPAPTPAMAQPGAMTAMATPPQSPQPAAAKPPPPPLAYEHQVYRAESGARFERLAQTETPFVERLVMFWMNHFTVSVAKGGHLRSIAGSFEREAIRPHVLGRFADMLKAVETHPAMLFYLDNPASTGPESRTGLANKRGLNENLAREILELHTLGVDGGYSQADVTSFARVLTGWNVTNPDEDVVYGGRFSFAPGRHEPGAHSVLGVSYAETTSNEQGLAVLEGLSRHPATAAFVARKLAKHFVADDPPKALVDALAKRFIETDGDLAAVSRALIEAPGAWEPPATKMRSPIEFVAAVLRLSPKLPDPVQTLNQLAGLGQPLWQAPGPNGWSDRVQAWASPEGLDARLDLAALWGRQLGQSNPKDVLDAVLGPVASAETRQAVARAESRPQGLAILFMSPEFQRR